MYCFLKELFFSSLILLLASFKLSADDELLSGNSATHHLKQPYMTNSGELRVGYFHPYNTTVSTDNDLLNVVAQYIDATGLRLGLCSNKQKPKISWEFGVKPALLSMPNVKTLTLEVQPPEDFFQNICQSDSMVATSKISTFQAYGFTYDRKIDLEKILGVFQELKKLVLYSCEFIGLTPTLNLNVKDLRLWDCSIQDRELDMLVSSLPYLNSIRIAECQFDNKFTENYKFTNKTIDILSRLDHLEELSILTSSDEYFISNDYPARMYPSVASNNHKYLEITDLDMTMLRMSMPQLRWLRLGKLRKVGDEGAFQLSEHLKILHLEGLSDKFTDEGFRYIINSLKQLEDLTIGGYRSCNFRSSTYRFQAYHVPVYCQISQHAFKSCKNANLKKLHLIYCENINDSSLIDLVNTLPNLIELAFTNCPNISDTGLATLKKLKPEIKITVSNQTLGCYIDKPDDPH